MSAFWYKDQVIAVGFYGCRDADRIVSVRWAGKGIRSAPAEQVMACPACRSRHRVRLMWRRPRSVDEWQAAEVRSA